MNFSRSQWICFMLSLKNTLALNVWRKIVQVFLAITPISVYFNTHGKTDRVKAFLNPSRLAYRLRRTEKCRLHCTTEFSSQRCTASSYDIPSVGKCTRWVHGPMIGVKPCTQSVHFSHRNAKWARSDGVAECVAAFMPGTVVYAYDQLMIW
jgi:hypothetical protein